MSKPEIPATSPKSVPLKAGDEVWWCSCGRSKDQPFCDGSHRVTDFEPVSYRADKAGNFFFCQCKLTKTPPFCDGSHKKLADQ
ncbi:MAG: CDGSH iron-sulfur domain-containing protein [Chromatiaceae bacterium]|nr:CDGSH iron-sulfur domain-containing protein [Gammaproteobacteria bacterium]MCP5426887.1 CDGSH iron-sulfur domain-containing protein [Chromatiaceae bacterium]MCB1861581.1 CDGSH iron-sulfur domain-containing protein [Gammaproteobacteria bacterium]MCB1871451.1 CDGSH iron-sulfur domain-containing protein [Gammaproteobacteria bacterium]MCB1880190.1 CDGSH iron-sulfur domain-containing protein [Gammaproteobacteria bacterium]